jgi:hypothetical protein
VLRKLKRGALTTTSYTPIRNYILCIKDPGIVVGIQPSVGLALANIVQKQYPIRLQRRYIQAWKLHLKTEQARRAKAGAALAAAAARWERQRIRQALRFWLQYTLALLSERLGIRAPVFEPRLVMYEEWLWEHHRQQQLAAKSMGLRRIYRLRMCLGKMHTQ